MVVSRRPGVDGGPGGPVPAVVLALLLLPVVGVDVVPGGGQHGAHQDQQDQQGHSSSPAPAQSHSVSARRKYYLDSSRLSVSLVAGILRNLPSK